MATKEELAEEVDEVLELDIDWSQLKKEDLETLSDAVDETELAQNLIAHQASDVAGGTVEEKVKGWEPGQYAMIAMSDEFSMSDILF